MALRSKKNECLLPVRAVLCVALLLFCCLPSLPVRATERQPYVIEAFFCRLDAAAAKAFPAATAPASLALALRVTPQLPDVSLYASASQARGKVTELGVTAGGKSLPSSALFPKGVEKPDPLTPGARTHMFVGPFTVLVPLPPDLTAGEELHLRLTALACSPVNCTPLTLTTTIAIPDAAVRASLPDAAALPWWSSLKNGVVEPLALAPRGVTPDAPPDAPKDAAFGTGGAVPRFGAVPLPGSSIPSGEGLITPQPILLAAKPLSAKPASTLPATAPDAFLSTLRPEPFTPGLEVASFGKAAFLGFLAGILLNLMPCVLPVLGIKLAALLGHGGGTVEGVRRFRRHQLFFAGGILAWFTVMAGLFHFLDLAWGQIFQSPAVVFVLAALLLLLALNLFGVFSLPLIDMRAGGGKNPDVRAFAEGFGATLLATPCGGPLLGGVLSWALLQPLGILALTLECVGLGMAFPYLVLAAFPSLARRFPRPGPWMGTMEQILGFLLLGTVAYLVSLLPLALTPRAVAALVLVAFGGWLWPRGKVARFLAAACVVLACVWPFQPPPTAGAWQDYTPQAFSEVWGKRPVLVDFTADWCPTCKVVEATALREENLRRWERDYGLALFRVDLTRESPAGEAFLKAVGSASIPVIAIFPSGEKAHSPFVLRDIVTGGQVAAALAAVAESQR